MALTLDSSFVGAYSRVYETEVSPRLTMNYAASTHDNNPLYFDDLRPGGVIAPPMSIVAITWPLSSDYLNLWDPASFDKEFPYEVMKRQVHFSETIIWKQMVRPGDKLRIKGTLAAILPHRGGTHLIVRYDATNESGKPVFTEYIGGLLRRVRCLDEGKGQENLPVIPAAPPADTPLWVSPIQLSPLENYIYDACTNMYFPIHTSPKFAKSVGLKQVIYQGTGTLTYAVQELTNREAGGDPTRLLMVNNSFTGMVLPGTTIQVRLLTRRDAPDGSGDIELFWDVTGENGKQVLGDGYLRIQSS